MKNRITKILSVATTLLMLSGVGASASELTASNLKLMYRVTEGGKATNLGGIALDEHKKILYGVKSSKYDKEHYLFAVDNYSQTKEPKNIRPIKITNPSVLGHANGMTFYNDSIYVATNHKRVIGIDNTSYKSIIYNTPYNMPCIAHYTGNKFILFKSEDKITNKRVYVKSDFSNIKHAEEIILKPREQNVNDYIFQDIAYNKGYIYIPATKKLKDSDKPSKYNIIYKLPINGKGTPIVLIIDGHKLFPTYNKFEIESLVINSKGTGIIAFNVEDKNNKQLDGIYKIPNINSYFN